MLSPTDLAMEAAQLISATTADAGSRRRLAAQVPLACAIVAGLRVGVLATHSTQALAESLLRLLTAATTAHDAGLMTSPSSLCLSSGGDDNLAMAAAAVALAAVVNRWQDAAALDSWLHSAFQAALYHSLTATFRLSEAASTHAAPPTTSVTALRGAVAVSPPPSERAVRAVGWVGRALALRNHPALSGIVEALLSSMRVEPAVLQLHTPGNVRAGDTKATAPAAATAAVDTPKVMDVDGLVDLDVEGAPDVSGGGACGGEAAAAAAAMMAAAEAFGAMVAGEARASGIVLAARAPLAVCRVLWQQRTYALCVQVRPYGYTDVRRYNTP